METTLSSCYHNFLKINENEKKNGFYLLVNSTMTPYYEPAWYNLFSASSKKKEKRDRKKAFNDANL